MLGCPFMRAGFTAIRSTSSFRPRCHNSTRSSQSGQLSIPANHSPTFTTSAFPPLRITPTRFPATGYRWLKTAASPNTPVGSTTSLSPRPHEVHGADQVVVAHGQHVVHVLPHQRKGVLPQVRRARAVGDGVGVVDGLEHAGLERAGGVIPRCRLDADDLASAATDAWPRPRTRSAARRRRTARTGSQDRPRPRSILSPRCPARR